MSWRKSRKRSNKMVERREHEVGQLATEAIVVEAQLHISLGPQAAV